MSLCRSSVLLSAMRAGQRCHAGEWRCTVGDQLLRVNAILHRFQIDEGGQLHSRLSVGRQPHHFPLVTVALKAKKLCKFAVEISHRIWKRNHQHRVEPAVVPMPDRTRDLTMPRPSMITTAASSNPEYA